MMRTNTTGDVVHPATTTDRYGNEVKDWANATRATYDVWLEQTDGDEETTDRETPVSDWLLMLPPDAVIAYLDRFEEGGRTFEVTSPPDTKWAIGGPHHIETRLRHTRE